MGLDRRYGVAIALNVGALAAALALRDFFATDASPLFTLTVILTAWLAGLGPALLSLVLSIGVLDFLFFEPLYTYSLSWHALPWLTVFTAVTLLGSALAIAQRKAMVERRQLLGREQHARRLAEEANRSKDEFLAILGHELRNPLGAVINAMAVLDHRHTTEEQQQAMRAVLRRQVRQLHRLVEDLVDVARLTGGKIALTTRPVDVSEVVASTVVAFRSVDAHRHRLDFTGAPVTIEGDPERLEQMLWNLLTNSAKFTPPGGHIRVSVEHTGREAILRIRDTGEGIAADLLPRIFDAFVQGTRGLDRARGGLGVGLTLVRRIAELHGGDVSAASEGPDLGSEFTIRLPALAAAPHAA